MCPAKFLCGVVLFGLFATTPSTGDVFLPESQLSIERARRPEFVFRHSTDAFDASQIPDTPARAFRDWTGTVHLVAGYHRNYALVGSDLDRVHIS
jgi:hypothetical protein